MSPKVHLQCDRFLHYFAFSVARDVLQGLAFPCTFFRGGESNAHFPAPDYQYF
jgi:hypothetical protein